MEKIEGILDQNKTIARGLTLMNEKMEESIMSQDVVEQLPPIVMVPTPLPRQPMPPPRALPPSQAFQEAMSTKTLPPPQIKKPVITHSGGEGYKKSITSKTQRGQ